VDKQVSDSASTATALFCGAKANFKTVGVDSNVKLKDCEASLNETFHLKSIIKWAQDSGKRTGKYDILILIKSEISPSSF
jgi:alkaline phosphatase